MTPYLLEQGIIETLPRVSANSIATQPWETAPDSSPDETPGGPAEQAPRRPLQLPEPRVTRSNAGSPF